MNLERARVFLVLFLFFLSIYVAIAFYATTPKPSQPFIGFGVYSQKGLYGYAEPNSIVNINQSIDWIFNITNRMGSTQFVEIVSGLGNNQTSAPPNATSPGQLPVLTNSTLFVPNQNNSLLGFNWTITAVTSSGLSLVVNGRSLNSTLANPAGYLYRFFFELWTFNSSLGEFQYYSWLQVWFSLNR
jgi:hypothetical protein